LLFFLLTVIGISLSGVMMPGPVFAATISKSFNSKFAGSFVAIGHGIVEFPLMFLIYFGLYNFFQNQFVRIFLGIAGGIVLIYLGKDIFHLKYFVLWWVTVGTTLIIKSASFGLIGFFLFGVVHWLCDFFWYSTVSFVAHHSGKIWGEKAQLLLIGVSSLLLISFGVWFIVSSLRWIA